MNTKHLKISLLVSSVSLVVSTVSSASIMESELKTKFANLLSFTLGEAHTEFPQVQLYFGRTKDKKTCVVSQSSGSQATGFEVLTLDKMGNPDSEVLGYELSTQRKYDSLEVATGDVIGKRQLQLSSIQSLGGTSKVAYEILAAKGVKGLTDFRLSYQNLSLRSVRSKETFGDSLDCLDLTPLLMLNNANLGSLAGEARSIYQRTNKDPIGAYLKKTIPRCELESATLFSCEYAYQSQRIPDYLKVTYSLSKKGLGHIHNMEMTRGH